MIKTSVCILLLSSLLTSPADIDVAVPPGTPLEWGKDLHQPVPTGWRSKVPTTAAADVKSSSGGGGQAIAGGRRGSTVASSTLDYGVSNLYRFFGITTVDIVNHIEVKAPGGGLLKDEDVATGGGSGVEWVYMPEHPTELIWVGVAGCLRSVLHPELVSFPETIAYLVEVGETSLPGTEVVKCKVGERVKKLVTPVPNRFPSIKGGSKPLDRMINRLVVVELTSGFPHALDPTYARRTLALGDKAYRSVLDNVESKHSLLSRNAVAVLANFGKPEAISKLRKLLGSKDPVTRYRALSGLVRLRDRGAVPTLIKGLSDRDDVWRAACAHALGQIGNEEAASALMKVAGSADIEYLWSILPAVARLAGPHKKYERFFTRMEQRLLKGNLYKKPPPPPGRNMIPPTPDPAGTKLQVVVQMCRLGMAAAGNAAAKQEVIAKFQAEDLKAFYVPNQILLCNVLGKFNDTRQELQTLVETAKSDRVAVQALQDLRRIAAETEWLEVQAASHKVSGVQALALRELYERGDKFYVPVAKKLIDGYKGDPTKGAVAFVVGTALKLMGKTKEGNSLDSVVAVVEKALKAGMWARREGQNIIDITKAKFTITPPLLEISCIELGRLGDPKGVPALLKVLKSEATGGRGEAALALGAIGGKEAVDALVEALEDPKDGWLRFCAYESLKKLTGEDYFCDWLFGSKSTRRRAVSKYRRLAKTAK